MTIDDRARRAEADVREGLTTAVAPASDDALRAAVHRRRRRAARGLLAAATVVGLFALPALAARDDGGERVDVTDHPPATTAPETVPIPMQGLRMGTSTSQLVISVGGRTPRPSRTCSVSYRADVDLRPASQGVRQQVEVTLLATPPVARRGSSCEQRPTMKTVIAALPEPLEEPEVVDGAVGRRIPVVSNHLLEPWRLPEGWAQVAEWGDVQGPTWSLQYGVQAAEGTVRPPVITVVQGPRSLPLGALLPSSFEVIGTSRVRGRAAERLAEDGVPGGAPALRWLDDSGAVGVWGSPGLRAEELQAFADGLVPSAEPREPAPPSPPVTDDLPAFEATVLPDGFRQLSAGRTDFTTGDPAVTIEGYGLRFGPTPDSGDRLSLDVYPDDPSGGGPLPRPEGAERRDVRGRRGFFEDNGSNGISVSWSEGDVQLVASGRGNVTEEELFVFVEGLRVRS